MEITVLEISTALFKRDSKGNVRSWNYETGTDGVNYYWRTRSGIHKGKIVDSGWKIVEQKNVGKANETSLSNQAAAEAYAEFTKKRDKGYFDRIEDIDKFDKIKPMLASKYEDAKFDFGTKAYYAQPKLDGIRCIARSNGLWTRAGKEIVAVPHIMDQLSVFFEKYPDAILDGELYNHDLKDDFNQIVSAVRKTKPTEADIEVAKDLVQYHVYDVINMPDEAKSEYGDEPFFSDRIDWFTNQGFYSPSAIRTVETKAVNTKDQIDDMYGRWLQDGYEGQMVREDGVYQQNKRSKLLMKRKEFLDAEFKVVGVEEGKGNWAGYIKRFILELPDGREFGSGVRGNQELLKALMDKDVPDWATCRYFTPTPDGIPRFPVVTDWGYGERND
jgi:DNA ligase 1